MIKGRDIDQVVDGKEQSSAKREQWASSCILFVECLKFPRT